MRGRYFQTKAVMGKITFPVSILTAFLCGWLCFFFNSQGHTTNALSLISFLPAWVLQLLGFAVHFFTAVLLIRINSTFGIIHERASVQACAYLLLIAVYPPIQVIQASTISGFTFAVSIYLLLHTYQRQWPQAYTFHAFAFLGISSLAFPFAALFTPVFWLSMFNFNILSPRSFTASLLGLALPYWFALGHAYFYDTLDLFSQKIAEMATLTPLDWGVLNPSQIILLIFLLILFLTAATHQLTNSHKDNIRARIYLHFFYSFIGSHVYNGVFTTRKVRPIYSFLMHRD